MTAPEYEEVEEAVSMQSNILKSKQQQLEEDHDNDVCEYNEQTTSTSTLDKCPHVLPLYQWHLLPAEDF